MGQDRSGMVPGGAQTLLGYFWAETLVETLSTKCQHIMKHPDVPKHSVSTYKKMLFKSRPHMAALADAPEAKCLYIDHLS